MTSERRQSKKTNRSLPWYQSSKKIITPLLGSLVIAAAGIVGYTMAQSPENDQDFAEYFPGIEFVPNPQLGNFMANGEKVYWLNTANIDVNAEAIKEISEYIYEVSQTAIAFTTPDGEIYNSYTLGASNRLIYFRDTDDPKDPTAPDAAGYTRYNSEKKSLTTVITILPFAPEAMQDTFFNTSERYANLAIFVETCQSNLIMVNDQGSVGNLDAQELVCNSIGAAMALRQYGVSYDQYLEEILKIYHPLPGSGKTTSALVVPVDEYNRIPFVGKVISLK